MLQIGAINERDSSVCVADYLPSAVEELIGTLECDS
jgi:hypothetical protein